MLAEINKRGRALLKDKKNLVIILLTVLFALKAPQEGMRFVIWVLGGVLLCSTWDVVISRIFLNKSIVPKSAIITGFILSGVLDYHQDWYMLLIFSLAAILSKFIIRVKGKHIFNPANFALFSAALFKQPLTWSIESNIYLIIIAGLYICFSLKKLPHIAGFLLIFAPLAYVSGVNPFSIISWFFLLIMLIEPRTSGFGTKRGLIFGGIAGLTCFLMFKFYPQIDIFVASLVVANISRMPELKK